MKLNVLLAITDTLRVKFKNMISDHTKFYNKSQGSFLGSRSTYVAKDDAIDDPSKRSYSKVVTTVQEKLDYFIKESKEFIDALFSQEKTNSSGNASANLVVNDVDWGTYTSLELLRLKSLLDGSDIGNIEGMLAQIPVRSDAQIWSITDEDEYDGRAVMESPLQTGIARTSVKEEYILADPNLASGKIANYTPKVAVRTTVQEIGDYTAQNYSGEWSHRERAGALKRRNDLVVAVVKALKECNECDAIQSNLTADKIFGFILYNK